MAKEITPSCEVTGLPLPILPPEPRENGALLLSVYPRFNRLPPDKHHHWHPSGQLEESGLAYSALRNCRIQKINWVLHHYGYHNIYDGPEIPDNETEIFKAVVFSAAGVLPRQALDVGNQEYKVVNLSDEEHLKISKKTSVARSKPLSMFFADFVSRQASEEVVKEKQIDEFLDKRTSSSRRHEIARLLLSTCVDASVGNLGLDTVYDELKSQGFFAVPKPDNLRKTAKHYIRQNYMDYFIERLDEQLATS